MNEIKTFKTAQCEPIIIGDVSASPFLFFNSDCVEVMKTFKDNEFDLAIVDPPYGINADENAYKNGINCKVNGFKEHKKGAWDNEIPTAEYFEQLFRVSKNQIIWGANYFTDFLPPVSSWIIWDKMQYDFSFAHGEMAWNSFKNKMQICKYARGNESGFAPKLKKWEKEFVNIHPTQKPIYIYEWILKHYAKPNDNILDTHLGSGSICIAVDKANKIDGLNLTFTGIELDKYYFDKAIKRLKFETAHTALSF